MVTIILSHFALASNLIKTLDFVYTYTIHIIMGLPSNIHIFVCELIVARVQSKYISCSIPVKSALLHLLFSVAYH